MPTTTTTSPKRLARTIGVLYVTLFVLGPVAFLIGKADLFDSTDAANSFAYLGENESTIRIGMTAEALVFIIEIVASAMLYVLFRAVSRHLSMAAMLARFGQAVMQGVNLLWGALALSLAGGASYLAAFDQGQLEGLSQLVLDTNGFMIHVWGIFFGVHLALLAWLVMRSGFLPEWLGWLVGLGAVGYLLEGFGAIIAPGSADLLATVVLVLAVPAELAFTVWLVWKGVDEEAWHARAGATLT
ncbi:MAG: DUF4386 domain-containing protein [Acidimicrobiia bacterium]|nr:DUF4386 domain-containing protein [Acidimicrobiia bacterium]NNL98347.1 DUF4386 domain-containing protein [Acidimicrobiia bacterium]